MPLNTDNAVAIRFRRAGFSTCGLFALWFSWLLIPRMATLTPDLLPLTEKGNKMLDSRGKSNYPEALPQDTILLSYHPATSPLCRSYQYKIHDH